MMFSVKGILKVRILLIAPNAVWRGKGWEPAIRYVFSKDEGLMSVTTQGKLDNVSEMCGPRGEERSCRRFLAFVWVISSNS